MDMNSPAETLALLFFVAIAILISVGSLMLYVGSIIWSYRDAEDRGKPGCLVALVVAFLSWPLGWIAWLLFRPDRRPPRF